MTCTLYQQYPDHIHRGVKLKDKKIKGVKGELNLKNDEATFYDKNERMAANPLMVFKIQISADGIHLTGIQSNGIRGWVQEWWLNTKNNI